MRGRGDGVAGSRPMSTAVHITWHGAQINFGDLPPYLTYGFYHQLPRHIYCCTIHSLYSTCWRNIFGSLAASAFLFIRGLSCPTSAQTLLTQNCLKLTIPGFLTTVVTLALKKNPRSSISLEIRPQSVFRALLSFANNSAEQSGRVWAWQPAA